MTFMTVPPAGSAELAPLWEVGFGFSGLTIPDYRGSDESKGYVLPFPYVDYRGDLLKVDRKGIYSRIFQAERLRLEMSADASVPVKSDDNSARQGMPDLDPTFEIGPSLEVCLSAECKGERVWMFRMPLRAVIASDFSRVDSAGWVINPHLNFDGRVPGPGGTWNFGVAVGPMFANERFHEYYYGVAPAYATATRPVYNARGGYSGFRAASAVSKRFENYWVGMFARYDNLSGAVFEDSPLFRTRHAFLAGFGVAWIFARSSTLVNAFPSQ
ncbi:MAG: MipA/OmpV family protein [Gammaproteobacteria bacterium]|nr:MipA/OmpV family protein [Gammaproteobacteria bacterium]